MAYTLCRKIDYKFLRSRVALVKKSVRKDGKKQVTGVKAALAASQPDP